MQGVWIPVALRLPKTHGWYEIKTKQDVIALVPYVRTAVGNLVWATPDPTNIVAWLEK